MYEFSWLWKHAWCSQDIGSSLDAKSTQCAPALSFSQLYRLFTAVSEQRIRYHGKRRTSGMAHRYMTAIDGMNAQKCNILQEGLSIMLPLQTFFSYVLHFLSNEFQDGSMYKINKLLRVSMWSLKCLELFWSIYGDTLRFVYPGATLLMLKITDRAPAF